MHVIVLSVDAQVVQASADTTIVQCCLPATVFLQIAEQGGHPVIAVKSARVGDFNGKTLSTISTSLVDLDPDVPEAAQLRNWWAL